MANSSQRVQSRDDTARLESINERVQQAREQKNWRVYRAATKQYALALKAMRNKTSGGQGG